MIKINLYDYQRVAQEVTVQKSVVTAGMIVLGVMVLTVFSLLADNMRVSSSETAVSEAQVKVDQLKPQFDVVQKLKAEQGSLNTKISGLAGLRASKIPFARLMEDIGQITPTGVWLEKFEQAEEKKLRGSNVPILFLDKAKKPKADPKKKGSNDPHLFIKFEGKASSDRGVVRLMEGLESLSYLDHVLMHSSLQTWVANRPVRKFVVYAHIAGSGPKL